MVTATSPQCPWIRSKSEAGWVVYTRLLGLFPTGIAGERLVRLQVPVSFPSRGVWGENAPPLLLSVGGNWHTHTTQTLQEQVTHWSPEQTTLNFICMLAHRPLLQKDFSEMKQLIAIKSDKREEKICSNKEKRRSVSSGDGRTHSWDKAWASTGSPVTVLREEGRPHLRGTLFLQWAFSLRGEGLRAIFLWHNWLSLRSSPHSIVQIKILTGLENEQDLIALTFTRTNPNFHHEI